MIGWLVVVGYALTGLIVWEQLADPGSVEGASTTWRLVLSLLVAPALLKYVVQLLAAPWFAPVSWLRRQWRRQHRGAPVLPRISVIVPAWTEEVGIAATVRSALASNYPDFEVIVVNDGSTDATDAVMRRLVSEHEGTGHSADLVYLSKPNGGKGSALNLALQEATGELVFTTDADSAIAPEALRRLARHFEDPRVMSVAANVKLGNPRGALGLVQQLEYLYGFYFKQADALLGSIYIVGGAAAAYRRRVFDEVGGFDESNITEDIEMSTRIQEAGHRISYAPDAVVYTEAPLEWAGLARQRLRWKFGRLMTFMQYRHLFFSTARRHNKWLSLLLLPAALWSEVLLLFQPVLLGVLWTYTALTSDYWPILLYAAAVAVLVHWQVLTDPRRTEYAKVLAIAPIAWFVLHVVDAIEFQALVRSIHRLVTGRGVTWQRWQRQGAFAHEPAAALPRRGYDPLGQSAGVGSSGFSGTSSNAVQSSLGR